MQLIHHLTVHLLVFNVVLGNVPNANEAAVALTVLKNALFKEMDVHVHAIGVITDIVVTMILFSCSINKTHKHELSHAHRLFLNCLDDLILE